MAKLTDKFFNRVIEGPLEVDSSDGSSIVSSLVGKDIKVKKLEATSDAKVGGKLQVTGDAELFENIVDKDGHKRFIDLPMTTEEVTGITFTYAKGSLSGSHLLIVLGGTLATDANVSSGTNLADLPLPKWIHDKIVPIWQNSYIENKQFIAFADNWATKQLSIALLKSSQQSLYLRTTGSIPNDTNEKNFRIAFDLLIDNE